MKHNIIWTALNKIIVIILFQPDPSRTVWNCDSNSVHTQSSTLSSNVLGMASNDDEVQHLTLQLSHEEESNVLKV